MKRILIIFIIYINQLYAAEFTHEFDEQIRELIMHYDNDKLSQFLNCHGRQIDWKADLYIPEIDYYFGQPAIFAARTGNFAFIKELLLNEITSAKFDINAKDENDLPIIYYSAYRLQYATEPDSINKYLEFFKFLLNQGASLNFNCSNVTFLNHMSQKYPKAYAAYQDWENEQR